MPLAIVNGDLSQGHCWAATPAIATLNTNVTINGERIVVLGDSYAPHVPGCTDPPTSHSVATLEGSPNVFINGNPIVRDSDPLACGDVADSQIQQSVFINGGGNISLVVSSPLDPTESLGYTVQSITDSWPMVSFQGNKISRRGSVNQILSDFRYWCRSALNSSFTSNGFVVTLLEEVTNNIYYSYAGIGATAIPSGINTPLRGPLDAYVTYERRDSKGMVIFDEQSNSIRIDPSFRPSRNYPPQTAPTQRTELRDFTEEITIRVKYGDLFYEDVNIPIHFTFTTDDCT